MAQRFDPKRRRFVGLCTTAIIAGGGLRGLARAASQPLAHYPRVRLAWPDGAPLRLAELERGVNYVFSYPYVSTPCFLLNLGRPLFDPVRLETRDGEPYTWRGGVGPRHAVVAFSAICSHKMTHPAPEVSFISYHADRTHGLSSEGAGVIHCCSEGSIYDPAAGARVLDGPAPEPLAAIALDYAAGQDAVTAAGAYGGTLFDRFLGAFGSRLALEFGPDRFDRLVTGTTAAMRLDEYSRVQMRC